MGGLVTKRNVVMLLFGVMMMVVATESRDVSERMEVTVRSFFEDEGFNKLHACCPSAMGWNCYRLCRFKGNQVTCSKLCQCKLVETITQDCVRLNINSESSEESQQQTMTELSFKEKVVGKLHACCENSQRWNCYRLCRLGIGSQQQCANYCSCVLMEEIQRQCYRSVSVDEIPDLKNVADGELTKLPAQ